MYFLTSGSLFNDRLFQRRQSRHSGRTDLTADHVRGLYSGMARKDVEDLLGTGDKSLADHEKIDVYSLSDGSTAVLRYRDDTLLGAYLRDKDNIETSIFGQDTTNTSGTNGVTDTGSSLENSDLNNAADSATEAGTENGMTSGGDSGIGTGTGIESESGK